VFSNLFSIILLNIGKYFFEIHFPVIYFSRNLFSKKKLFSSKQTGLESHVSAALVQLTGYGSKVGPGVSPALCTNHKTRLMNPLAQASWVTHPVQFATFEPDFFIIRFWRNRCQWDPELVTRFSKKVQFTQLTRFL
jgi:hypothetical protein